MEPREDGLKKDLEAAVRTRQELGGEYESELIDSFLGRLDARLDAQVERRVNEELARQEERLPARGRGGRRGRDGDTWFAMFSLIMAIPLSGIAVSGGGGVNGISRLVALLVTWIGVVGVNAVRYMARQHSAEQRRRPQQRGEWA